MTRASAATLTLAITILLTTGAIICPADDITPAERDQIRQALPDKPIVKPAQPRHLLVYTGCKGFRHDSIPYATAMLELLGQTTGAFDTTVSAEPAAFKPENLHKFDAICFNNTTGELFADQELKQSLLDYVRAGGGIVGIHAATDCFYQWPEFGQLMGGYFDGHPWNENVTLKIDDPRSPLTAMFADKTFQVADEIYQFKAPYSRDHLRILLSLDTDQCDMSKASIKRTDGDFAVSWIQNFGRGRVFYCSLGHRHDIFWNPTIIKHYLAGIQFALGDRRACAVPSAQIASDGWANLFNGEDLTGWICPPNTWTVTDGVLTRQGGGDIWTEQVFCDFILELDFKLAPQTNSGVFFRTGNIDDCVQTGIEMQVLDSYGKADPGPHDCGAIYDCVAPSTNAVKPAGEWNHVRLTCRNAHIEVVLNDTPIIDMNLDEWITPNQNPDGTKNKFRTAYKDMPRCGRIGFQDHGKPVWYRNIRIKCLGTKP